MRIFLLSFLLGATAALTVEAQANHSSEFAAEATLDEPLPLPLHSPNASPNSSTPSRIRQADIIKASRVERAKRVAEERLQMELLARWNGINTARPTINAGYMYLAPPPVTYRWYVPILPTHTLP